MSPAPEQQRHAPPRPLGRAWLRSVPLWWTGILLAGFLVLDPHPLAAGSGPRLAAAFLLAAGFWSLFFALAGWLYRRTRVSLLVSGPVLLAALFFAGVQQFHHYLYGRFIDAERLNLIRANWDLITGEVARLSGVLPAWLLPGALLGLLALLVLILERSRRPVYRPLAGLGGLLALASVVWAAWWVSPPLRAYLGAASPDLAGQSLAEEFYRKLEKGGRGRAKGWPGPDWLVKRAATRTPSAPARAEAPPDIVLVLLESVRADHLSVYGYQRETTPNLDRWAAQPDVVRFPAALANATFSYFSLVSLASGLDMRRSMDEFVEAPLIWDHLKARGYDTAFVTLSLGYPGYRLDRYLQTPGLDLYRDLGQEQLAEIRERSNPGLRDRLVQAFLGSGFHNLQVNRDDRLTLEVFQGFLEGRSTERPFFGVWELECTHFVYCYPEAFRRYEPASSYGFSRAEPEPLLNEYNNAILYLDHLLGRFFEHLEASGLADTTIVVVASDHGEAFYENGKAFHGGGLHPEQTRVPLLIRVPPALRGRFAPGALEMLETNAQQVVQLVDLLPTVVGLADGGPLAADLGPSDGANLLEPLPEDREIYVGNYPPFRRPLPRPRDHAWVRDGVLVLSFDDGRADLHFELPRE
jgi:glucan phosphoethanolaminetransferase (alkaline phosphatase superfamily)